MEREQWQALHTLYALLFVLDELLLGLMYESLNVQIGITEWWGGDKS